MIILITGSRDWTDAHTVERSIRLCMANYEHEGTTIVHGDCKTGADAIAARLCKTHCLHVASFPADWKLNGKAAGPMRNTEMVTFAGYSKNGICLAFWDGKSKGTLDCFSKAVKAGMRVNIYPMKAG